VISHQLLGCLHVPIANGLNQILVLRPETRIEVPVKVGTIDLSKGCQEDWLCSHFQHDVAAELE
jgi:hypothetical protein